VSVPDPGVTQHYTQWYETATLEDGPHQVIFTNIVIALDYAIIIAGESTSLKDRKIIVDDQDTSQMTFSGSWNITMMAYGLSLA